MITINHSFSLKSCFLVALISILPCTIIIRTSHAQAVSNNEQHVMHENTHDIYQNLLARIENLMEEGDATLAYEEIIWELERLSHSPLHLNTASRTDLASLIILTDMQIHNLHQHIKQHGELISVYELQSIEGFDLSTIQAIIPYVTISRAHSKPHFSYNSLARDGNNVLFLRYQQLLEEQAGFAPAAPELLDENPNARYLGSPCRLYARYRYTWYQHISIGITAEKDPGEEFFTGSQPRGFDFYSAHIHLRDLGRLKSLSVGDFQVQFGQGLTLWSGMGFGKSSQVLGVPKNGLGLRPYTSVDENNFLRGLGVSVQAGPMEITGFWSSKRRDASMIEPAPFSGPAFSSLQQTGLHRTPQELKGKNAVRENIMGGHLRLLHNNFQVGATAYHLSFDADFSPRRSFYNQFNFSNNQHYGAGVDFSYLFRNMQLFGETAFSQGGGIAVLKGLIISMHKQFSLAILYRNFHQTYQAPMAAAFGENTRVTNEKGLYLGAKMLLLPELTLKLYADHFAFPWMKHRTYMPTMGYDYMALLTWKPMKGMEISLRSRQKNKPINGASANFIRQTKDAVSNQQRLHLMVQPSESISLRSRIEITGYRQGAIRQKGFMIYQDVLYRPLDKPFALTFRYALFDTDGFNARIYAYEHDVLYAFSFPFYTDKGCRTYLLVRYRIHRQVDFYARLAQTVYQNRSEIGSGLGLIEGNTRTEVKLQVRVRF